MFHDDFETPQVPVAEMTTSALMAELVSYLGEKPDFAGPVYSYGYLAFQHDAAAFKARRNAVAQEIDRRIPMEV